MITVVDEGPTVMGIGHTRHAFEPDFEAFIGHHHGADVAVDQLTDAKLDQLLQRWAGVEWLAEGFRHLDRPAAERADVERGLRLYCQRSRAHAERFDDLYRRLPASGRVLPGDLVGELLAELTGLGGTQPPAP